MQSRPIAFSIYGQQTIYVAPIPDQTYSAELDTVVQPTPLLNVTDVDTIQYPFTEPIPYYAAYKAKFKEQSYKESELFEKEFKTKCIQAISASFERRIPNPYA